jgi:hypothetical protein
MSFAINRFILIYICFGVENMGFRDKDSSFFLFLATTLVVEI